MLIWLEISFAERARKVPQIPLVLLKSRRLLFLICLSVLFLYHSFSFQFHGRIANVLPLLGAIVFLVLLLIIIRRTWVKLLLLDDFCFYPCDGWVGSSSTLLLILQLALADELLVNCSCIPSVLLVYSSCIPRVLLVNCW